MEQCIRGLVWAAQGDTLCVHTRLWSHTAQVVLPAPWISSNEFIFLNCRFSICKTEKRWHLLWGFLEFGMPVNYMCNKAYCTEQALNKCWFSVAMIPAKVLYATENSVDTVSKEPRARVQGCSVTDDRTPTPTPAEVPKRRDFTR